MSCCVILLAIALATNANQGYFKHVLSNPSLFDNKRISLVGLAHIEGDRFYLYESKSAAASIDLARAVFVREKEESPSYDPYNNRWVKVTGVLAAKLHGPLGFGFPCEILLEQVQLLDLPPEKQWPSDLGRFQNQTSRSVRITLYRSTGDEYAQFELGPGGFNEVAIHNGRAVAETLSGNLLAKTGIFIPQRTHQREEPVQRRYSYRISDHAIEAMPAQESHPPTAAEPPPAAR